MNGKKRTKRYSKRAMVGLLASLMLLTTIIPSAAMADSSMGGGIFTT
jgi:hypothetical protein